MIEVQDLSFSYTARPFLEKISFAVGRGTIFGFLGPSGAGKSTLQKILIGLIPRYQGSVVVNGVEMHQRKNDFYETVGVDFEYPTLYEKFTARENLRYFGSLYRGPLRSMDELLERVGLLQDADKRVADYSKGMKSRLGFVAALLHNPDILFLDEPTSGLDPSNARLMKDMILEERDAGKCIILTTHNMYDATELCDQVAFLAGGRVQALDSPRSLMMSQGAATLRYTWMEAGMEYEQGCPLAEIAGDAHLQKLMQTGTLTSIHSCEPTLNDIFLQITGRSLQ